MSRFLLIGIVLTCGAIICFSIFIHRQEKNGSGIRAGTVPSAELLPGAVDLILPEETADEAALSELVDWQNQPTFRDGIYIQQSSAQKRTNKAGTPKVLISSGNRDMNNFICKGHTTDEGPTGRIPFHMEMDSCPETYVKGFVISRFEGSGRMVRLWITTSSLFKLQYSNEILRFYIDDDERPLIQLPLVDAISKKRHSIFFPPFGAGSRYYLAWYYPVVFQSQLIISLDRLRSSESYYYQTNVVLDRRTKMRKSSTKRLDLRDTAIDILNGKIGMETIRYTNKLKLIAKKPAIALHQEGPRTIQLVKLQSAQLDRAHHIWLQVYWDDLKSPSVDIPLLSLFASELAKPEKSGLLLSSKAVADKQELILRMPMPFKSRSIWKLENRGTDNVSLKLTYEMSQYLPRDNWGYLTVQRFETIGPTRKTHHPLVKAKGRGRLLGVCISMEGLGLDPDEQFADPLNFLEGDERGIVDGRIAIIGTGTEDYLNSSFYFADGSYANPFAQAQKKVRHYRGEVVGCRWHILSDTIDFRSSMDLSLEIGPNDSSLLERYRSVAFLYQ